MLKSNIAWMKKNVPSDLKVWKGMIQDIDWSQVAAKTKLSLQRDKDRITAEFKDGVLKLNVPKKVEQPKVEESHYIDIQ